MVQIWFHLYRLSHVWFSSELCITFLHAHSCIFKEPSVPLKISCYIYCCCLVRLLTVVSFTRLYSFSSLCKDVFSRTCAMYDMFSLDQFSASVTTQHASLTRSLSPMTASVSSLTLNKADQFSSVQDGIFALRNSPYAFHPIWHLSEVSPSLPLKWFQCLSDWRWPLVLSRKIF